MVKRFRIFIVKSFYTSSYFFGFPITYYCYSILKIALIYYYSIFKIVLIYIYLNIYIYIYIYARDCGCGCGGGSPYGGGDMGGIKPGGGGGDGTPFSIIIFKFFYLKHINQFP